MKLYEDIDVLKNKYILYGVDKLLEASSKYQPTDAVKIKITHGLNMSNLVGDVSMQSNLFNETYEESARIEGLLHDIGRFEQFKMTGTLYDYESSDKMQYSNHGQLGGYLLKKNNKELLRNFIEESKYDEILIDIISNHTIIANKNYDKKITQLINLFNTISFEDVLNAKDEELINKLIALKLKVLREQDALEVLINVVNKNYIPYLSIGCDNEIKDEVWKLFSNFEYLNMSELKKQGLWTSNCGVLLRYSLIYNNINLVATLKNIQDKGLVDKVYKAQISNIVDQNNIVVKDTGLYDKRFKEAYLLIKEFIKEMINTSPDGVLITSESKELAKKNVKRMQ